MTDIAAGRRPGREFPSPPPKKVGDRFERDVGKYARKTAEIRIQVRKTKGSLKTYTPR